MDNVLVTGGNGFLGKHVVKKLLEDGYTVSYPNSSLYDLRKRKDIKCLLDYVKPDTVIHLAAACGGIGINREEPGTFLYDNALMGLEMINACKGKVQKFVQIGTVCSYPKYTPVPFKEENIWDGYPEETNAPYGIAKKLLLAQCQAYRQQYGMNAIYLIPVNLYGPGDNFDLFTSHVIPALISKCVLAKEANLDRIIVWGDGTASREFLYVEDAAEAIALAAEKYNGAEPVNIGAGWEITIHELVETIKNLVGYTGTMEYDHSKPNGQPRRCLDVSKAKKEFGFEAKTSFIDGLRKTVDWYVENINRNI